MNQISFKGQFVSNINIKKAGYPIPAHKASIVEVNPVNNNDLRVLKGIHELWNGNFTNCIYKEADKINRSKILDPSQKFYLLTEQKENFGRLNPNDVLAEAKVMLDYPSKGKVYLDYLQVQPENSCDSSSKMYEGLGSSFLNFLKKYYKDCEMNLRSLYATIDFYKKNGFKLVRKDSNLMKLIK